MTIDDVIARFLAVWGEPKSDHAEQFIAEYRRSLAGTSPEVLKAAADAVIDNEDYWPRPAAFRRHVNTVAARLESRRRPAEHATFDMTPPSPEQRERVAELVSGLKRSLAAIPDAFKSAAPPPSADRGTFEGMRQSSRNDYLHRET